jgi:dimethylglycine dehydrogenase
MQALYRAIWAAAEPAGGANVGLYAINSLRMEKGYRGWGAEMTNEITLIEADMERFFAPDKGAFLGREATQDRVAKGVSTRLAYVHIDAGDNDARGGEAVFAGETCVGVVTSGGYGHSTGLSLAWAYLPPDHAILGTELTVELLGKRRTARVLAAPVHDPGNTRPRA